MLTQTGIESKLRLIKALNNALLRRAAAAKNSHQESVSRRHGSKLWKIVKTSGPNQAANVIAAPDKCMLRGQPSFWNLQI